LKYFGIELGVGSIWVSATFLSSGVGYSFGLFSSLRCLVPFLLFILSIHAISLPPQACCSDNLTMHSLSNSY
jgi:hypothetical protein